MPRLTIRITIHDNSLEKKERDLSEILEKIYVCEASEMKGLWRLYCARLTCQD